MRLGLIRLLALGLALAAAARPAQGAPNAFQVDYVLTVRASDPEHVQVRWRLAGIDEIRALRLRFRDDRTTDVHGSGQLDWQGRHLHWTPGGPYGEIAYTVAVDRRRPSDGAEFDSCAMPAWIATRAMHLFPEINVDFIPGVTATTPTARLILELPRGWRGAAPGAPLAENVFAVEEPGRLFYRPRGWLLLGRTALHAARVAGMHVTVAVAPRSALDADALLHLYAATVPELATVLGPPPPRLLVVSAPDPMWHGGLSGENSFFVNGRIPLSSVDRTSTYLHELFHVWAPFDVRPDGHWVSEGLAEYYTLRLQERAGRLTAAQTQEAIARFRQSGRWHVDLTQTKLPAALNNSAPFVMAALDELIRKQTGSRRSLDDAVRTLLRSGQPITTGAWLAAIHEASGRRPADFFQQHVHDGAPPPWTGLPSTPMGTMRPPDSPSAAADRSTTGP